MAPYEGRRENVLAVRLRLPYGVTTRRLFFLGLRLTNHPEPRPRRRRLSLRQKKNPPQANIRSAEGVQIDGDMQPWLTDRGNRAGSLSCVCPGPWQSGRGSSRPRCGRGGWARPSDLPTLRTTGCPPAGLASSSAESSSVRFYSVLGHAGAFRRSGGGDRRACESGRRAPWSQAFPAVGGHPCPKTPHPCSGIFGGF
jgi:hypothetical protein